MGEDFGWPAEIVVEGYEKRRGDIRPKRIVDPTKRQSDQSLLLHTRTTYVLASERDSYKLQVEELVAGIAAHREKTEPEPHLAAWASPVDTKLYRLADRIRGEQ